jgi:hypothetical protein
MSLLHKMQLFSVSINRLSILSCFACATAIVSLVNIFASTCCAGGPENVLVVVNAQSQASLTVANHYVALRNIPGINVVYLDSVPSKEQTDVETFRANILEPVLKAISDRKLGRQIDYIVYSADFPTAINCASDVEEDTSLPEGIKGSKTYRPIASINSLTYFSGMVMNKQVHYLNLNSNWYMRSSPMSILNNPFVTDDQEKFDGALKKMTDKKYDEAMEDFNDLFAKHRTQIALLYQMARCYAKMGDANNCARALNLAAQFGWCYREFTLADVAFASVKDSDDFKTVIGRIPELPFEFLPTQSFRSSYIWGPNGIRNGTPDQGQRYVLSTVLAVTRNRGTTVPEAIAQMKQSVAADATMPKGTFYFTQTGDVRTKIRSPNFEATVRDLKQIGYHAEIINAYAPKGKKDVLGVTLGTRDPNWNRIANKLVPGAICDNLTSYGGIMRNDAKQMPCTEFIKAGAAGASGTVVEPYSIASKFPHPRIHYHYARGCTLGEAFYQSVHGPFQLLIVGDALCQPFCRKPEFTVTGLKGDQKITGQVELEIIPSRNSPHIQAIEVYVDGVLTGVAPPTKPISFDSSKLSDGYHEIRLVALHGMTIQSKRSLAIPFQINNDNKSVSLSSSVEKVGLEDKITLDYKASFGEKVELIHNHRVISTSNGNAGAFVVDGNKLGEGPVQFYARIDSDDEFVRSNTVELEIKR